MLPLEGKSAVLGGVVDVDAVEGTRTAVKLYGAKLEEGKGIL